MVTLSKLLVTGLARNAAETLPKEVRRLLRVTSKFYDEVFFHIVESDSSDKTVAVLGELGSQIPNFSYQNLGQLQLKFPHRIERLRHCRNSYVEFFRQQKHGFDHILVVDFDIRNRKFDYESMEKILSEKSKWDALFVNQTGRYFDIFALREKDWCPTDCMFEVEALIKSGSSREAAKEKAIWEKMKKIPNSSKLIEVDSAFGGMGIYKSWIFDRFNYDFESTPIAPEESEHVALHFKARAAGARLFIHPGFNNFAWSPHNLASFRALRRLDYLSKRPLWRGVRRKLRSLLG